MRSLAEGIENIVRDIQTATEQRKANLSKLRSDSLNLIENFGFGRRDMALSLKDKLNSGEKARLSADNERLGEARDQLNQRDGEIEQIRANVSELRSDSYNLIERFGLERKEVARSVKDKLNQQSAQLKSCVKETRDELSADFRQAGIIWSSNQKKSIMN